MTKPQWLTKEQLHKIIFESDTKAGRWFDIVLICAILLSIVITFVESVHGISHRYQLALEILEYAFTFFFTLEYLARLYCAPRPRDYALSFFGIVDLLATLPPYLSIFFPGARYMILLRTMRVTRVFRIFKLFSFINEGYILLHSLKRSMNKILVYFMFVLVLVICIGTLMYIVEGGEPNSGFKDLGTSVYWAIVTMTTVGYGDITPVTAIGRFLSAFVMLLGYTIIAIPTGIVSVAIIDETQQPVRNNRCPRCDHHVENHDNFCAYCGEKL